MDEAAVRARPRALLVRRLLVALAAVALLVSGAGDLLPAPPAAAAGASAAAAADQEMHAPAPALAVRGVLLQVVPVPAGVAVAVPPGSGPLVAAHLVGRPQARPPTAVPAGVVPGVADSRGPPARAGT